MEAGLVGVAGEHAQWPVDVAPGQGHAPILHLKMVEITALDPVQNQEGAMTNIVLASKCI